MANKQSGWHYLLHLIFVFTCIYDLLVVSENETDYLVHLIIQFERLERNGLVVNPAMYHFCCTKIDF